MTSLVTVKTCMPTQRPFSLEDHVANGKVSGDDEKYVSEKRETTHIDLQNSTAAK